MAVCVVRFRPGLKHLYTIIYMNAMVFHLSFLCAVISVLFRGEKSIVRDLNVTPVEKPVSAFSPNVLYTNSIPYTQHTHTDTRTQCVYTRMNDRPTEIKSHSASIYTNEMRSPASPHPIRNRKQSSLKHCTA